jgi:hypothetical protein
MVSIEAILLAGCAVVLILLLDCYKLKYREGATFANQGDETWDKWDNYSKNNSNRRDYWGQMDPEGGWQGNPYAPKNNPGGYGFPIATGAALGFPVAAGVGSPHTDSPTRQVRPDIDLASASDDELTYMYNAGIMD